MVGLSEWECHGFRSLTTAPGKKLFLNLLTRVQMFLSLPEGRVSQD